MGTTSKSPASLPIDLTVHAALANRTGTGDDPARGDHDRRDKLANAASGSTRPRRKTTSTAADHDGDESAAARRLTPAMRQYARFKKQFPECVLFFRMGDFYEMFEDDARTAHKVLGITLTQRTEGVPMAGVPYHSVENYLRRMIEAGYRVAVCEQVEDPRQAKGVVDRAVTRVLTPGTLVDESLLDESASNQVAAIMFTESGDHSAAVLALAELSTGAFTLHELPGDRVIDEMMRLAPSELLHVETADGVVPPRVQRVADALNCALTARPAWSFRISDAGDILREHFGTTTLTGFGIDDDSILVGSAGALVRYLRETQPGPASASSSEDGAAPFNPLAHLRPPRLARHEDFLVIDAASLASLEIERTIRTGQVDGSLLSVFAHCRTSMGRRLLRRWLCFPLRDVERITQRQDAVAALRDDPEHARTLADMLGNVQDVARIAGRIAMQRATPRDLVALGRSTASLTEIRDWLEARPAFAKLHATLATLAEQLAPLSERILAQCIEDPPAHMREGGLFRDGVDAQLDEARLLQRDASSWLVKYQKQLIDQSGIQSLKVGYNKVFGYYIEVSHANASRVPDTFTRKQTLKNAERYITPELKEFEDKITTAESRAIEREAALFDRLCRAAAQHVDALARYADTVAALDVLQCFADVAVRYNYCRPTLTSEPLLDIRQGRHPVLDRTLADRFVPNDCRLGSSLHEDATVSDAQEDQPDASSAESDRAAARIALITGPNMAGKSTYIRQVALITLLAHTGSFVPAERATIGMTDRIFTRIGASDELHAGQSTFMVEMTETANILHHATPASLVILDEIGRGTSTLDGLSLAWAIAESLAEINCRTLFATHYHELTSLADRLDNVGNLHVAVREWGERIIFLYRILPGRTDRSYGIHVAQIAGLPPQTVHRAQQLLETLAVQTDPPEIPDDLAPPSASQARQMSLFTEYVDHPAVAALRELDLNALTPLQAFDALRDLHRRASE